MPLVLDGDLLRLNGTGPNSLTIGDGTSDTICLNFDSNTLGTGTICYQGVGGLGTFTSNSSIRLDSGKSYYWGGGTDSSLGASGLIFENAGSLEAQNGGLNIQASTGNNIDITVGTSDRVVLQSGWMDIGDGDGFYTNAGSNGDLGVVNDLEVFGTNFHFGSTLGTDNPTITFQDSAGSDTFVWNGSEFTLSSGITITHTAGNTQGVDVGMTHLSGGPFTSSVAIQGNQVNVGQTITTAYVFNGIVSGSGSHTTMSAYNANILPSGGTIDTLNAFSVGTFTGNGATIGTTGDSTTGVRGLYIPNFVSSSTVYHDHGIYVEERTEGSETSREIFCEGAGRVYFRDDDLSVGSGSDGRLDLRSDQFIRGLIDGSTRYEFYMDDTADPAFQMDGDSNSFIAIWKDTDDVLQIEDDIRMGDNEKIYFGDDDDFSIVWDGNNLVFSNEASPTNNQFVFDDKIQINGYTNSDCTTLRTDNTVDKATSTGLTFTSAFLPVIDTIPASSSGSHYGFNAVVYTSWAAGGNTYDGTIFGGLAASWCNQGAVENNGEIDGSYCQLAIVGGASYMWEDSGSGLLRGVVGDIDGSAGLGYDATDAICVSSDGVKQGTFDLAGLTITNAYGFKHEGHTEAGGRITNCYGLYLPEETVGDTINCSQFIAGAGQIAFRDTDLANQIYSNATNELTVEADSVLNLDVNGTTIAHCTTTDLVVDTPARVHGDSKIFGAGGRNQSSAGYLGTDGVSHASDRGIPMPRAGSVTAIAVRYDVTSFTASGTITFRARKNGSTTSHSVTTSTISGTGAGSASLTLARDNGAASQFAADDFIAVDTTFNSFEGTYTCHVTVEVIYDD